MFKEQFADLIPLIEIAHIADKGGDGADARVFGVQAAGQLTQIKQLGLNLNSHRSTSGHLREEGDLVEVFYRSVGRTQLLIQRAHEAGFTEHLLPNPASGPQPLPDVIQGAQRVIQRELFITDAKLFPVARKVVDKNHWASPATKVPDFPPCFFSTWIRSMTIPRSTALHMS